MIKHKPLLTMLDLMRLVEADATTAQAVLKTGFEWDHGRRLEVAKWLLAIAAAALVAIFTLLARTPSASTALIVVIAALSGVAGAIGLNSIRRARSVHRRYAEASLLCARLAEIRPFLATLRRGDLL